MSKPPPLRPQLKRLTLAALLATLLAPSACGPATAPATPSAARACPSAPTTAAPPTAPPQLASALALRDAGQLDAALRSVRDGLEAQTQPADELQLLELQLLGLLDPVEQHTRALELLNTSPETNAEGGARALAQRIAKSDKPKPPTAEQGTRQAGELAEAGVRLLSGDPVGARALLDRALYAYLRATGSKPRALALQVTGSAASLPGGPVNLVDMRTQRPFVLEVLEQPVGKRGLLLGVLEDRLRFLTLSRTPMVSHVTRLVQPADDNWHWDAAAGQIFVGGRTPTRWLTHDPNQDPEDDPEHPFTPAHLALPSSVPKGARVWALAGGYAVFAVDDRAVLVDRQARVTELALPGLKAEAGDSYAKRRFWSTCGGSRSSGAVVVLDGSTGKLTVRRPPALQCTVDTARAQLVLVSPHASDASKLEVELRPMDGGPSKKLTILRASKASSHTPRVQWLSSDAGRLSVAGSIIDLERASRVGALTPQLLESGGNPRLLKQLTKLVPADHHIAPVRNSNALLQLSPDGRVAITMTAHQDGDEWEAYLLGMDVSSGKRLFHNWTPYGASWLLMGFFDAEHIVVASGEVGKKTMQLYRVGDGDRQLAEPLDCDNGQLHGNLLLCATAFAQLGLGRGATPLPVAPVMESLNAVKFHRDGSVTLTEGAAPRWLHCAFGEQLAPWPVCAARLVRPPAARSTKTD